MARNLPYQHLLKWGIFNWFIFFCWHKISEPRE